MATESMSNFEIPAEMRKLAEQSVEQAKKAVDEFMAAARQTVSQVEGHAARTQAGVKDVRGKAMTFAEENVSASFEFAKQLAQAKDLEEMFRLQTDFMNRQLRTMAEQARELGQSATAAARDMTGARN